MTKQTEHADRWGHLRVPIQSSGWSQPEAVLIPSREGWEPFFVSVNGHGWDGWEGRPQRIVSYRRVT
jgi:hypothetical protein